MQGRSWGSLGGRSLRVPWAPRGGRGGFYRRRAGGKTPESHVAPAMRAAPHPAGRAQRHTPCTPGAPSNSPCTPGMRRVPTAGDAGHEPVRRHRWTPGRTHRRLGKARDLLLQRSHLLREALRQWRGRRPVANRVAPVMGSPGPQRPCAGRADQRPCAQGPARPTQRAPGDAKEARASPGRKWRVQRWGLAPTEGHTLGPNASVQ